MLGFVSKVSLLVLTTLLAPSLAQDPPRPCVDMDESAYYYIVNQQSNLPVAIQSGTGSIMQGSAFDPLVRWRFVRTTDNYFRIIAESGEACAGKYSVHDSPIAFA